MMQQNFKKDSRVWLHKNSRRKFCGPEMTKLGGKDHQVGLKMKMALEEDGSDSTPHITGADGRVYKKDSRTWLHKSSGRGLIKTSGDNVGARPGFQAKNSRRMWDVMHKVKELVTKDKASTDCVMTSEGGGLTRAVVNGGKRKKNTPRGRSGLSSISHRDIHMVEECDENVFGGYTHTHTHDKRPRVRYVKGSYSDYDNTNDESSRSDSDVSNSDDDLMDHAPHDRKQHHRLFTRLCECPLTHAHSKHATLNCNGCDSLPLCRSNGSVELTQDGINAIRDIARNMQLPAARSCSYLVETPDPSVALTPDDPHPINPMDLTSGALSSSKSSLNVVGVNLSDECVTALEEVPGAESDYQLSQATKCLNVQSPTGHCLHPNDLEDKVKVIVD